MDIERERFNMVEQQIRPWNVLDTGVLDILHVVKRERFVPSAYQRLALADTEIPLAGSTGARMFAPRIEARVMQALNIKPHEKVFEVGTGSGHMAALLGVHADHVWTMEINPQQAEAARVNLDRAGVTNVVVQTGNGLEGLPALAPFDALLISGALAEVPAALLSQLRSGGRLLAFVGQAPAMQVQLISRDGDKFTTKVLFETVVESLIDSAAKPAFVF